MPVPLTSYLRTDRRLAPDASPLRSLATNTPPGEPAPVSVTPSLSGVPEPPGKRSDLPAVHPFAASGFQPPEPSGISRQS
ncbi:hypothetical protein GCM10010341_55560 [Streptomyces noursei]|nr:hypothetical protein GCM10010341_55560 [Streptomyces noursei]